MGAALTAALALALGVTTAPSSFAQPPPAALPRTEVPIREVMLSDGARRYAVRITVGASSFEAGLDTGSAGLRVLPGALAPGDAVKGGLLKADSYSYGSGTMLSGRVSSGDLRIGALTANIDLQLVDQISCTRSAPDCPVAHLPIAQYGVQGDGLPGEGFRAILGVNMADAELPTPLAAIGARRWIVELPRPSENKPGRLILNPTDEETARFVMLPISPEYAAMQGGLHDAVLGCLVNPATKAKACGLVMLDTGAPGIRVHDSDSDLKPWPQGAQAALTFYASPTQPVLGETFTIDDRVHASHLQFETSPRPNRTVIFAGINPYLAFDVLYDPAHQRIGLAPRADEGLWPKVIVLKAGGGT